MKNEKLSLWLQTIVKGNGLDSPQQMAQRLLKIKKLCQGRDSVLAVAKFATNDLSFLRDERRHNCELCAFQVLLVRGTLCQSH